MKDNALYLEADEDITSAIDKLQKTPGSAVQIVVPKRSTMLQSIINLKLLKKAAEQNGKELVLVTNDRIAGDLAGRVGLAVAPSLGAKAVISEAAIPEQFKSNEEVIEADDPEPPGPIPAPVTKPTPPLKRPLLKRRALVDEPPAVPASANDSGSDDAGSTAGATTPPKSGPKVPNFGKLRRRLLWVGLAGFLVVGYMVTMYFITSVNVTLYANGTKVSIDTSFAVDPNAKTTDKDKAVLAGQVITVNKDLTSPFTPTGKKDVGTKAAGAMTIYNEYDTSPHTMVAGTRFQAPDGKIFRTRVETIVPGATIALVNGEFKLAPGKSEPVDVEADAAGDTYNEAPARYIIPAYTGSMQTKIYGQGAQMSGGTSKTITVVTAADVDTAKTALLAKDKENAGRDLRGRVPAGYVELPSSQTASTESSSSSPAIDAEASSATVTLKVTYTVLAVKQTEYQELVRAQEVKQIGNQNQIYDDGLAEAQVTASEKSNSGRQSFHLTTEAYGGPKLDTAAIADKLKGQRYGDATTMASRLPGVNRAEVVLNPAWATNLPKRTDKIKITIQVADHK